MSCPRVQVDIRFPQPGSDEPDKVTVTGLPETVDNAIDHLLNLEEEYVSSQRRVKHQHFSNSLLGCFKGSFLSPPLSDA